MKEQFIRTEALIGSAGMERLSRSRVAVFGIGGVGGYAAVALARSGVGEIDIIDNDNVSISNLNRQIIARHSTIGRPKVDVMSEDLQDINPDIKIHKHNIFFLPETELDFSVFDYVIDAIDTVTGKIEIIMRAKKLGIPVISSMGTGNKLHPEMLELADIYSTSMCPLSRVMRRELKARGVKELKVVYSKEEPIKPAITLEQEGRRAVPGSSAFVPSAAGLIIAGEVIRDLIRGI